MRHPHGTRRLELPRGDSRQRAPEPPAPTPADRPPRPGAGQGAEFGEPEKKP